MAKQFTFAEVAEHNKRNDCWITIFGKVYNVTKFLDEHPGGGDILLGVTAKDATTEFEDVGHSHDAWQLLDRYYIGEVNKSTIPANAMSTDHRWQGLDIAEKKSKFMVYLIQFLVPLIVLNVVAAFFSKSSA